MIRFSTIVSGSSGNCAYVGVGDEHFLVDAGLSGKRIQEGLKNLNVPAPTAIFITHEHSDHIQAAGVLARRFGIPVYATPLTWRYFLRHGKLGALAENQVRHILPGEATRIGSAVVTAFDVSHDASQPVGYTFEAGGKKLAMTTDLGKATETVVSHMRGCQAILLESNHDVEMLQKGKYPADLKARVMGARGHLSNVAAAELVVEVAWDGLRHVVLGHLSEENNRPMLAFDTVGRILDDNGITARLTVADRFYVGEMVEL